MSVKGAIRMAANQRFVNAVDKLIRDRGFATQKAFLLNVYGVNLGSARRVLTGKSRARTSTLKLFAEHLGVPFVELDRLYDPLPVTTTKRREIQVIQEPRPIPEVTSRHDPLSFQVHGDGTASLKLDLRHIPVNTAMDVMSLLQRSGFFATIAKVE